VLALEGIAECVSQATGKSDYMSFT